MGDGREEGVIGKDEKERGKRTALLDPAKDVDEAGEVTPEAGGDADIHQGGLNKVSEPGRKAGPGQDLKRPLVVNGVEGLGSVKEEEEMLGVFFNTLEEELVDLKSMVHSVLAPEKAFLRGVDQGRNNRHGKCGNGGGEDTIVSVSNTDGAGVGDEPSVLLRDEKEDPMVEARRRGVTTAQLNKNRV